MIKPTNDTTSDDLMMTTTSGSSKRHKMALQKKAANFLNAFCLPGVVIVRYGHVFDMLTT